MTPIRYACGVSRKNCRHYTLREEKNNFAKNVCYSSESIQWLDYFRNENIAHAENSIHGEMRIENYSVDGFDATTNTIDEYYGCFHHGHSCNKNNDDDKKRQKTMQRAEELRRLWHNVVSTTSCEWFTTEESETWYHSSELSNTSCSIYL